MSVNKPNRPAEKQIRDFGEGLSLASILVIDDETGVRIFLVKILAPRCKRVLSDECEPVSICRDTCEPMLNKVDATQREQRYGSS